nr:hypothetical protein OG409_32890 [Streptomyces sp. NBC_00974]
MGPLAHSASSSLARLYAAAHPHRVRGPAAPSRVAGEVPVPAGEPDSRPGPALAARLAALFPKGVVAVQRDGGHVPRPDDAPWFAARIERFPATGA